MEKKEKPGDGRPVPLAGTRLRSSRLIPPMLFAFFFIMDVWVFVLCLAGAAAGWPDATLSLLARCLSMLGILSCAGALLCVIFGIVETLVFRRVFYLWFALVCLVLGTAGLALGILGGVLRIAAAGRLPEGVP